MIKFLLGEDDPMVTEVTKTFICEIEGYSVEGECRDGSAALEYLKEHKIDLIMADVSMPNMDGITFVKELRRQQNNSDIIFVTAAKDSETVKTALKYGAVDYIVKPYDYDRFTKTMESYKKRFYKLNSSSSIEQNEIDSIITKQSGEKNSILTAGSPAITDKDLPKGIHSSTLAKIIESVNKMETDEEFTINDFSETINMSTVSLRHYMEYLCSEGLVECDTKYGSVGRPRYVYRKV